MGAQHQLLQALGGVDDWNDCPNDDFRFNSNLFEGQTQEGVWQITYELLSLFNGASTLLEREPYKLSIYKILLEGASSLGKKKGTFRGCLPSLLSPAKLGPMISGRLLAHHRKSAL
ncbi:hypothetical protein V5O39_26480 [Pseudomonas parakoreensis]